MAREARLFLYICSVPAVQRSLPYDTTAGHYRTTIMIVCCQYRTTVVTAQRPLPHLPADAKQPPPHNYHTLGLRQHGLHTSPGFFDVIVGQLDCTTTVLPECALLPTSSLFIGQ